MFWKVINGVFIAAKLKAMTNLTNGIDKVINTVTLNHRQILSETKAGKY